MGIQRTLLVFLIVTAHIVDCSAAYQILNQANQQIGLKQEPSRDSEAKRKQNGKIKQQTGKEELKQERPEEITQFINNVRSAQPEFAADLLIRLAESPKVADPAWKRELIEDAFRLAATVQQPIKRVALPSSPTDTRAGFLASAFGLKMDALSLQCRAVDAMLLIDKQKARELFGEIPKLQLQPLTCEDALVYDVSYFYSTLKKVVETSFSQKEVRNNEPLQLAESYIGRVVSPVELSPSIDVITSIKTSRSQLESLVYVFSKQLGSVSGDDRSFATSLFYVDRSIKNLAAQCLQVSISADGLLRAYRTYLIRHFSSSRCADNDYILSKRAQSAVINDFNNDLRLKSEKNISEISPDDIKPLKVEGIAKTQMHWQTPKASALLMKIKKLRFGSGDAPLSVIERESLDWQAEKEGFLKDLADWKKEDEKTEEDYFHQKSVLFRGLIELIPKETVREDLIRKFIEFLNSFDLSRGSRIEWFWQARFLLKDTPHVAGTSNPVPTYVIRRSDLAPLVENTKNPVLYLYAQAEKLLSGTRL
jgi:hypothetical protein